LPWVESGSQGARVNQNILARFANKRAIGRIDGQLVATMRADFYTPFWIFERDEYALQFFRIYLESTRGDV
jgi:hypothetical protein